MCRVDSIRTGFYMKWFYRTDISEDGHITLDLHVSSLPNCVSKFASYMATLFRYIGNILLTFLQKFSVVVKYNNNNNNFFCANVLENQAQWRDKTKGLINLLIESNA